MPKITESLPDLMEKVKFCRIQSVDGVPDALIHGEGTVVGLIIGVNHRANVMVKDAETSVNKAYTLEPMCINPTPEAAQAYLDHRAKLNGVVKEFNDKATQAIADGNAAVDAMNEGIFGPQVKFS